MFYVKGASIVLKDGNTFSAINEVAQQIYNERLISEDNLQIPGENGPVFIPFHSISFIAFKEDAEANDLQRQIDMKWQQVMEATDIDDDNVSWSTDGNNTYISYNNQDDEPYFVSDDPGLAMLLLEIQNLEDRLEMLFQGEEVRG